MVSYNLYFFREVLVNRWMCTHISSWSPWGCSSCSSRDKETSAIRKESVEQLLILMGARRRSLLGVKGRRLWALWEGATLMSISVSISQGGLWVKLSTSGMNAGFSMPASMRYGRTIHKPLTYYFCKYVYLKLLCRFIALYLQSNIFSDPFLTSSCICVSHVSIIHSTSLTPHSAVN